MAKLKFSKVVMHNAGVRAILNSEEVQADILARAEAIRDHVQENFDGEYVADVRPGQTRAHAMVKTMDGLSAYENHAHNALLKSLDAGRL